MEIRSEASVASKTGMLQALVIAVLYGSTIVLLNKYIPVFEDVDVRIVTFVPVIGGLLFGAPAAIGSFIGNMLALEDGCGILGITSDICNSLLAYGTFRLWYSGNSKHASFYLNDIRGIIKFIKIVLFNSFNIGVILGGAAAYLAYNNRDLHDFFILFNNNFIYPIAFGIPILWVWQHYVKVSFVRLKEDAATGLTAENLAKCLGLNIRLDKSARKILLAVLLTLEAGFLLQIYFECISDIYAWILLVLGILIWFILIIAPSTYEPSTEEKAGYEFVFGKVINKILIASTVISILNCAPSIYYYGYTLFFSVDNTVLLMIYSFGSLFFTLQLLAVYLIISRIDGTVAPKWGVVIREAGRYADSSGAVSQEDYHKLLDNGHVKIDGYIDDIDIIQINMGKMEQNIRNKLDKLSDTLQDREAMEAQLKIAKDIQHGVLPDIASFEKLFRENGYSVSAGMQAAKYVGGDMYDCVQLDDDHMLIMVADVAGKGVPGALFMMVTQALIKQNAHALGLVPGDIIAATNDTLSIRNGESLFVTMWLGILELSTGRLRYTNAGHNPPLLAYAGQVRWIKDISGPVLGLMDGMEYRSYELQLPENSKFLLYTDGINEAENGKGGFYGNDRLEATFLASASPEELLVDIRDFVDGAAQSDDMTYLWLSRSAAALDKGEGGSK